MNSGVILIDKPKGISSFQAVSRVRKKTGIKKAGHTGTLDPMATGLLTICLGRATRMARFLTDATKTYQGTITLGAETDTFDAMGRVLKECPLPGDLSLERIQGVADRFTGLLKQSPPPFSAAKHKGKPLYKLARQGIKVEKQPRDIEVYRFSIDSYEPPVLAFTIDCSKGTYIRSLAHDLGQMLGCGAYLSSLRRTRNGMLSVDRAVPLDDFLQGFRASEIRSWVMPVELVLSHIPAISVDRDQAVSIQHGQGMSMDMALSCLEEQVPGFETIRSSYLRILTGTESGEERLVCMAKWPDASGGQEKIEILRVWNPN
jgi:tRNA pseudouridine55 synthase